MTSNGRFQLSHRDHAVQDNSSAIGAIAADATPIVVSDPVGDPDREWIDRALGGDRSAFEALIRKHYQRIHRVAWRITGSRTDAEDIAQEVCCTLVEKLGSFKGESRFTTWLTGIVVNASRDHRRRGMTLTRLRERLSVL